MEQYEPNQRRWKAQGELAEWRPPWGRGKMERGSWRSGWGQVTEGLESQAQVLGLSAAGQWEARTTCSGQMQGQDGPVCSRIPLFLPVALEKYNFVQAEECSS